MAKKRRPTPHRRARATAARPRRRFDRRLLVFAALGALAGVVAVGVLSRGDGGALVPRAPVRDDPVHVHGLGINPKDGALFIATHSGLWRVGPGQRVATRVGERAQDTMGFTVVGPDRFLGSGHPDVRDDLPPLLGLIESTNAGRTWRPVSLLGEADFHVLRFAGSRVYGYDASNARLMISGDRGRTWVEREPPGELLDLAVGAGPRRTLVAAGTNGLATSSDDGRTWRRLGDRVGLLAWPAPDRLYLADGRGEVVVSRDGGREWTRVGEIGGEPAALLGASAAELYAALHDGTVLRSSNGGRTWAVRSTP